MTTGREVAKSQDTHDVGQFFKPPENGHKDGRQVILETAVRELFSSEKYQKLKTSLREEEAMSFAAGFIFADTYNCKTMRSLLENLMDLKVSVGREGRREFVDLVKYSSQPEGMEQQVRQRNWFTKLLGR